MLYLLLLSGAALFAAGAVLAAQARVIDAGLPIPRPALGLLATFAVTHGASDWVELAHVLEQQPRGDAAAEHVEILHVLLLAASFLPLLVFGLTPLGPARRRSSLAAAIAGFSVTAWVIALAALLLAAYQAHRTVAPAGVEFLTRWLLGLPASLCAAIGLLALARTIELESWVGARFVRYAGLAFVVHGIADAIVSFGNHHPAWPFLVDGEQGLGLAFGILETASASAIAVLISEAFVFQTSQRLRREETHLRDDFIALVAHELGTPVSAIEFASMRLELARRAGQGADARLSEDVRACAQSLRRIVRDMLDASRIHAHELEATAVPMDLRPVLARAAEVASACDTRRPPVAVSCPDELPPVLADAARVDQILGNLLTNASKYSAPGSPVVVSAELGGGAVTVRVINDGSRITPEEASRIFTRHYRADAAVRGPARGLGLGLYVARGLVEAQGGRIWVDTRDQRTAFCFTLPLPAPARAAAFDAPKVPLAMQ